MHWNSSVSLINGVGEVYAKRLKKLEIETVGDLLTHIPMRYEDLSKIVKIKDLTSSEKVTVTGHITTVKTTYTKNRKVLVRGTLSDETGSVPLMWFNQPYIENALKGVGLVAIAGTVELQGSSLTFISPEHEVIYPGRSLLHMGRLVPVYPQTEGVSSKWLRSKIALTLKNFPIAEFLPYSITAQFNLLPLQSALPMIHFPKNISDIEPARKRLAFDELFLSQIAAMQRKTEWTKVKKGTAFQISDELLSQFNSALPFKLTAAQEKASKEILTDLSRVTPMNRLLQGDVGSGKTVIAAQAAFFATRNNQQTLIMAPTEILAQQHFSTLTSLLSSHGIKVDLLTSSHKMSATSSPVIVGTHALLEDKYEFARVGLVVIDEQHRFGVSQRGKLRGKGVSPHILTMTATPIPRTIMLTAYGDLKTSILDELPVGRLPITTRVVPEAKRIRAYDWIRQKIAKNGSQVFVVCPFIEPSETLKTIKAVKDEYLKLTGIFPEFKIGLLHGKLASAEKNAVLSDFKNSTYQILLATPVVEVGIDIPNATIMVIEAAERFGLSQLHQLRGRVGRGDKQSFCLLFTSLDVPGETSRLRALESTNSGFKLAELDLKIRGPGAIFGTLQHGQLNFKIARYEDFELIPQIQRAVEGLIQTDSTLTSHPDLKLRLKLDTIQSVSPD